MTDQQFFPPLARVPVHRSTTAVPLAHVMLWLQAGLFTLAWVLPIGLVAAIILTDGVPDDGSSWLLLIPVFFAVVPFLLSIPGIVLAATFSRRRNGVRLGVIGYELLVVALALVIITQTTGFPLVPIFGLMLLSFTVLVVLLHPGGRAYFGR
jgi:hypothetical protein